MTQVIEKSRLAGPGSGQGDAHRVIVLNDNHNTFEGVAGALATHIPGYTLDKGLRVADEIHAAGSAVVWSGVLEVAEHYAAMLAGEGLTMAPVD